MTRSRTLFAVLTGLLLMVAVTSEGFGLSNPPWVPIDSAQAGRIAPGQASDGARIDHGPRLDRTDEGFLVVAGHSRTVGKAGSPLITYTLEVTRGLRRKASELKQVATRALMNTQKGWTSQGLRRLQRTADPAAANIRIILAEAQTVDTYCARVGSMTNGQFSCWDGSRVMLNVERWDKGARDFASLDKYRHYLVNHEFGHGLGFNHLGCPEAGEPAPVMMQQTKSTGACQPNGWPFP